MPERDIGFQVSFSRNGKETLMGESGKNPFRPAMNLDEAMECATSLSIYFGEPTVIPMGKKVWVHTAEEVQKQRETNIFSTVINVK